MSASAASGRAGVPGDYKKPSCRAQGAACGGPFGVAGECCAEQMCTDKVPGDDAGSQTGVCRPKCTVMLKVCESDAECCAYWGPQRCSAQLGLCVPAGITFTDMAAGALDGKLPRPWR